MRPSRFMAGVAVFGVILPGGVVAARADLSEPADTRVGKAVVRDVRGNFLGTIALDSVGRKLSIRGRLGGLAAGFHGFHVHAAGVCDPRATDPSGTVVPFFTAGPHLDTSAAAHGQHTGDLPLLYVAADGVAATLTENDKLNAANLFDANGSAIIVHAAADNYANIPVRYSAGGVPGPDAATLTTGDSGGRVACGVITRP